jgi:2-amino-4-hydroxy-6-hydroxymethyldihydropteridine diphosphokinase
MASNATLPVRAYIGLGSNLGDPFAQVTGAVQALAGVRASRLAACSPWYSSAPLGGLPQPDYVNGVAAVDTELGPLALLDELHRIERQHGRIRDGERWAPRTLDLDLLVYGEAIIRSPSLTVPHPALAGREFVLYPLAELAPELTVPGLGRVCDLLRLCPLRGLKRLDPP